MATVLPFHRAIVRDPAFTNDFTVHTRWIETEFDNTIPPFTDGTEVPNDESTVTVLIGGRPMRVSLPGLVALSDDEVAALRQSSGTAGRRAGTDAAVVAAPMQGTIVKIAIENGQRVDPGDLIAVVEAMKMENPVVAGRSGVVTGLALAVGATVAQNSVICEIEESG
jgi:acetyl-CoA/propionyl-CoA/long-chain acyl-CoA carboxylase, biotin carboxylase, biotin carboxyl carrier protein